MAGGPTPAALPLTGAVPAAGALTPEHVSEIHNVLTHAPGTVSAEDRAEVSDRGCIPCRLAR